jgi:lipopolysaccharide transport system permease protein
MPSLRMVSWPGAMTTADVVTTADDRVADQVTVIGPIRGWRALDFRELWEYRELLAVLVSRDVRIRYRQTALGASWALLRPALTMLVFTAVFGRLARMPSDGSPYAVFVYSALLPWTFFAAALTAASTSLVNSATLVSKTYFPRLIIPLASIGGCLVDVGVSAVLLAVLMIHYRVPLRSSIVLAPVAMAGLLVVTAGIGIWLAAVTVRYRDFVHVLPFVLQIWLYVTPVIYPSSLIPARWQWLLWLNPLAGFIDGFRAALLGTPFDQRTLLLSWSVALVVLFGGIAYFERVERRFADVI